MSDIVPELQEQILSTFKSRESIDLVSKSFWQKVKKETANPKDAAAYSKRLGEIASDVLEKSITEEVLPDGKLYFNIADRTVVPLMKEVHSKTNEAAIEAQKIADKTIKVKLNPMQGEWPEKRMKAFIQKMADIAESEISDFAETRRLFKEPVVNISQSFYNDFVEANVNFRNKSGLKTLIIREELAKCCKWCNTLAGEYDYETVPKDVYRRHDNCKCIVTFRSEKGYQNVWNKKTYDSYKEARIERLKEIEKQQAEAKKK